jgi:hypothetical protein
MFVCLMISMLIYLSLGVHGIYHWNVLGFKVYFFSDIHVDIFTGVYSFKTTMNINGFTI